MSSLNPFAARREKKEAQLKERIEQFQQQQLAQQGHSEMMTDAQMSSMSVPIQQDVEYDNEDFDKYLPAAAQVEQPAAEWQLSGESTYQAPSRARQCMYRLQNAFMIGASLGGAVGFMYGTYASIAYRHVLYLPIAVVQAAGGFGFFLACGTVIRCDEPSMLSRANAPEHAPNQTLVSAALKQNLRQGFEGMPRHLVLPHSSGAPQSAVIHAILSSD